MMKVSREEFQKRILEKLAELEHEQWCAWATTILQNEPNISSERRSRWLPLISKPYCQLSEHEKRQDRMWARGVLEVLEGDREQFEQSLKELQKALALHPNFVSTKYAHILGKKGAVEAFRRYARDTDRWVYETKKLFSSFQGTFFFGKEASLRKTE